MARASAIDGQPRWGLKNGDFTVWRSITRRALLAGAALCAAVHTILAASTNDLASALQKGLFEEEANHNYPAAIEAYQGVINRFDEDRKLAATAIFRVGEIYRKQGKTNEASAQYERVVREFSDQSAFATLSQSYLGARTSLSTNPSTANLTSEGAPTSDEAEEVKKIRAMIRDSPDLINAKDQGGSARLHTAALQGHLIVARFLVESGADVNAQNRYAQTPLHIAASGGHKALVELLLSHGANVQIADSGGDTSLHLAAQKGFRTISEVLLTHGADVNAKAKSGAIPLHLAVANGFKSVAELLLNHGADVNSQANDVQDLQQTRFWGTPLHFAAARDDQAIAELLLAHKADPNATNNGTPLHTTARRGNQKLTELLLANKAAVDPINSSGETPLDLAAKGGFTSIIALLLSHGANINARNSVGGIWPGWTPLHYAVSSRQTETTTLLLKNKADPNAKTENSSTSQWRGCTPLLIATMQADSNIVASLLEFKADPNAKGDLTTPPIFKALDLNDRSAAKSILFMLLDHGADIESQDDRGNTLLIVSVERKDKDIVDLLLAHKADVNAKNLYGRAPLHVAVSSLSPGPAPVPLPTPTSVSQRLIRIPGDNNPHRENPADVVEAIIEALVAAGANVNLQDNDGKTPLNYLLSSVHSMPPNGGYSHARMERLLREHGAVTDLPRVDAIEVRRSEANFSKVIFTKGTNAWDQFTLFDLIGAQYALLSTSPAGDLRRTERQYGGSFAPGTGLEFPDFKHVRIRHPKPDRKSWDERTVDIETALRSADCSADVLLQLGEQVEIPEADHEIGLVWNGLDKPILETLKKCLTRGISVIVKDRTNSVSLGPEISYATNDPPGLVAIHVKKFAPFMIKPALLESKLLLTSSDLSRIKLIRTDPATDKKRELIVDCSENKPAPSVWLRDGDIIEVPDKP